MKKFLRILKRVWFLNFIRRVWNASKYFNRKYVQIIKWGFSSREDTNYTYDLTPENVTYLAQTIAAITKISYAKILEYINEALSDDELKNAILNAIKNSDEKKFSDREVRFGRRLGWYAFVRAIKPEVVVETGVDKGLGSILLCSALLKNEEEGFNGYYFGTDINPKAGYYLTGKYKNLGEILYGDSIDSLSGFQGKIDLFINDSDHSSEYEYGEYQTIKPLIDENTIILGDNAHCTDKLSLFSLENKRNFIFFQEQPLNHWYPGAGIGISWINCSSNKRDL